MNKVQLSIMTAAVALLGFGLARELAAQEPAEQGPSQEAPVQGDHVGAAGSGERNLSAGRSANSWTRQPSGAGGCRRTREDLADV